MNKLLLYLVESGVCLLVFYLLYALVLKRETCFQYNRFYLLASVVLSLALPLIEIPFLRQPPPVTIFVSKQLQPITITANAVTASTENPYQNWLFAAKLLYALGFSFFLFRLIRQLWHLYRFTRYHLSDSFYWQCIRVIHTEGKFPTFSFWQTIYLDNSQPLNTFETERVLEHEAVHVRQQHSRDILFLELVRIVFWFNPLLYLYQKALVSTHEFIADAQVLKTTPPEAYANLLVKQLFNKMEFSVGHYFNKSLTLKRMNMIQQTHRRASKFKPLLALPVLATLVFLLSSSNVPVSKLVKEPPTIISSFLTQKENNATPNFSNGEESSLTEPVYPGGQKAFYEYLVKNIKYPADAFGETKEVFIVRTIVIGEDGEVVKYKLKPNDDAFAEEVSRVINNMPAWKPATKAGKPIEAGYIITFKFSRKGFKSEIIEEDLIDTRTAEQLGIPESNRPIFSAGDIVRLNGKEIIVGQLDNSSKNSGTFRLKNPVGAYTTAQDNPDDKVFTFVEQNPAFPGGLEKMYAFLGKNMKYPEVAKKAGLQGIVIVQYTVNTKGLIRDVKILKSLSAETDAEAKRIIGMMPVWTPGKQNGKLVNVRYTLPIRFSLKAAASKQTSN